MSYKVSTAHRLGSNRGAVLYLTALGMVAFLGIAASVVDFGIWFTARSEAQRAAESGAHAGASVLMLGSTDEAGARLQAESFAEMNVVRGVTPDVFPNEDIDVILDSQKVRVRVQRSGNRGNPLATLFARVMGINEVDIGAVAAAQSWPAVSTNCILPFAIPDRWDEWDPSISGYRPAELGDVFDPGVDIYEAGPGGTGYQWQEIGQAVELTTADPSQAPMPGWFYAIALPGFVGADDFRTAIQDCWAPSVDHALGEEVDKEPGNMNGPTRQAFRNIFTDPIEQGQSWSYQKGGPVNNYGELVSQSSRRVRPLVMFDPRDWEDIANGRKPVPIRNVAGVWMDEWDGNNGMTIRWMGYTALEPAPTWEGATGFLRVLRLVE